MRPVEKDNRTESGLYIPDTAKEKPQIGIVVAVGDDEEIVTVKVGQKVLFPKYGGTNITLEGVDYLIIEFDDLLAIVN
ncbi:MAG: co-chaperone GroES [Anaerolineaceae bacterium 4572_5.2]|nr:MAG: co-chaperone GroES [Anaerolineaceae bacterium 4572_5.2]